MDKVGQGWPHCIGAIRPARQHAEALIGYLLDAGYEGKSLPAEDLVRLHAIMCEQLGLAVRHWTAIGRELDALGVPSCRFTVDGRKLTYYEIVALEEPAEVVPLQRRA